MISTWFGLRVELRRAGCSVYSLFLNLTRPAAIAGSVLDNDRLYLSPLLPTHKPIQTDLIPHSNSTPSRPIEA
ncbi:hypothetical protein HBH70_230390 [Parastagonospora nodorum]|nr:hypothetical protein HBH53_238040 [Parastagonospora nodorum]KAH3964392.1 hypothetical protein HBH52_213380 [Parastagonospora nodorum]KAH4044081.1 hypothetical protein HBH49_225100 [Parastagonospora nodorum]KAH4061540.1 hypothetical protein HBH50_222210 [Parastagonospora nodorum]KAH4079986.1 hypothetical protein HBH48_215700 [Parastagonospora nodorum]